MCKWSKWWCRSSKWSRMCPRCQSNTTWCFSLRSPAASLAHTLRSLRQSRCFEAFGPTSFASWTALSASCRNFLLFSKGTPLSLEESSLGFPRWKSPSCSSFGHLTCSYLTSLWNRRRSLTRLTRDWTDLHCSCNLWSACPTYPRSGGRHQTLRLWSGLFYRAKIQICWQLSSLSWCPCSCVRPLISYLHLLCGSMSHSRRPKVEAQKHRIWNSFLR